MQYHQGIAGRLSVRDAMHARRGLLHSTSGMTAAAEAKAAAAARQAATDLCRRCSVDALADLAPEDLWFPVLQVRGVPSSTNEYVKQTIIHI